jgi:hypothetical protein
MLLLEIFFVRTWKKMSDASICKLSPCAVISIAFVLSFSIAFCHYRDRSVHSRIVQTSISDYKTIAEIPVPAGFARMPMAIGSFAEWLRGVKLKKDSRVYLYDRRLKENQSAQFAAFDIVLTKGDLQQCADAIMRLGGEYFFSRNKIDSIRFKVGDGTQLSFAN